MDHLYSPLVIWRSVGVSLLNLVYSNAVQNDLFNEKKDNVAPFEFIPWILGQCTTVEEAKQLLPADISVLLIYLEQQKMKRNQEE